MMANGTVFPTTHPSFPHIPLPSSMKLCCRCTFLVAALVDCACFHEPTYTDAASFSGSQSPHSRAEDLKASRPKTPSRHPSRASEFIVYIVYIVLLSSDDGCVWSCGPAAVLPFCCTHPPALLGRFPHAHSLCSGSCPLVAARPPLCLPPVGFPVARARSPRFTPKCHHSVQA